MLRVGIIGPTNLPKLSKLTKKPIKLLLNKAQLVGRILAEEGCECWINSDKGMLVAVGREYKKSGGKKLVVLYPDKGEPWPKEHAKPYIRYADELRKERNWFWSNYNVTALPDLCICIGLCAGGLSELAYIKWNYTLKCGNLKKLIGVRELLRNGKFPPEIEADIKNIVQYIDKAEDLKKLLEKFKSK